VFGKFKFAPETVEFSTDFKAENVCTYLGDFNGDGITDFAYINCMTPYIA
jgi:hypothetical protein